MAGAPGDETTADHWAGPPTRTLPLPSPPGRVGVMLRTSEVGLLLLALVVGAGAGAGAIVFRWLITTFTRVLTGRDDYSTAAHAAYPALPGLGRWFVVGVPVVAGLVYGPLVHLFAREARGHGVPEVMYAVARRSGRIAPQVAVVKALASALCIGGGGSVGREGPIVQIGSALGSTLGRLVRAPEQRMRVLVACGAAGGIAATFNAPLAGVFFAMELILVDFAARSFGMVVLASVVASVVGRAALGSAPFLSLPAFRLEHLSQYGWFALLGVLAGGVGVGFTTVLYGIEDACDTLWRGPEWLRPAAGGVVLGLLLLALPQMYGVGYPVLNNAVVGKYAFGFLVLLMVGKVVATSLTIGIGGSGGVFAPSLFIGAMLGAAFGHVVQFLVPGQAGPVGAYGLIGMGAVFAGAARAPITAVVIMFELTGEYSIILPLMAAIVLATGVSQQLSADTIYTLKLRRRGVDLTVPAPSPMAGLNAASAMGPVPPELHTEQSLQEAAEALSDVPDGVLPAVDASGRYVGILTAAAVTDALGQEGRTHEPLEAFIETAESVHEDTPLSVAAEALEKATGTGLPVLDATNGRVTGWLTSGGVLRVIRSASSPPPPRT